MKRSIYLLLLIVEEWLRKVSIYDILSKLEIEFCPNLNDPSLSLVRYIVPNIVFDNDTTNVNINPGSIDATNTTARIRTR